MSSPWTVAAAVALGLSVALRFVVASELWLDEAQSVAIARLPLAHMFPALRHDGSPPLYYLLLHAWMALFGTGDVAVRALSGLFSVACLPAVWLLARRIGGSRLAVPALLVLASSPFAIRYATETRMYSLIILLTALGGLALLRALDRPGVVPVLGLGLVSGLLALTHYWALFLLLTLAGGLLIRSLRRPTRAAYRRALVGVSSGAVLFLPWVPVFVFQMAHTGTPWNRRVSGTALLRAVPDWVGGGSLPGQLLGLVALGLVVLGVAGRALDGGSVAVDLRGRPGGRELGYLCFATLALAVAVGVALHGAFADRYTAVAFLPFVLLLARGVNCFSAARVRRRVLAVVVILGLCGGIVTAATNRTQARSVAKSVAAQWAPGDVVVYCPDQLGPAVSRLLPASVDQVVFPTGGPPQRVDWVDYAERNRTASAANFAVRMDARAGSHRIFLVWAPGYRTFERSCRTLSATLAALRPRPLVLVSLRGRVFEHERLMRFDAQ